MEAINNSISNIWDKSKKTKPSILYALDNNDKLYIVARDERSIVTLVVKYGRKIYTYVIPKLYLKIKNKDNHSYYKLINSSKLDIISCSNNQIDDMANFVAINIINKI
jgi:hypothetical protein